jgi:hypothetical protein
MKATTSWSSCCSYRQDLFRPQSAPGRIGQRSTRRGINTANSVIGIVSGGTVDLPMQPQPTELARSCLSIMPDIRCRWSTHQAVRSEQSRSLLPCPEPVTTPMSRQLGRKPCRTGSPLTPALLPSRGLPRAGHPGQPALRVTLPCRYELEINPT